MKYLSAVLMPAFASALFGFGASSCRDFNIQITNLMAGQVISGGILVAHNPAISLLAAGTPIDTTTALGMAVAKVAQEGDASDLITALTASNYVCGVTAVPAAMNAKHAIAAGDSSHIVNANLTSVADKAADTAGASCSCSNMVLSYIAMPVNTNDGLVNVLDHAAPEAGAVVTKDAGDILDAGVEGNSEACIDLPDPPAPIQVYGLTGSPPMGFGPCLPPPGDGNASPAGEGIVLPHTGFSQATTAIINDFNWEPDSVKISITGVAQASSSNNLIFWLWALMGQSHHGGHH